MNYTYSNQKMSKVKAVKGRVGMKGSHRESRQVRRDAKERSEHGLGAAHRLLSGEIRDYIGCDGRTRYCAGLSMYHVTSVVAEAAAARQKRI